MSLGGPVHSLRSGAIALFASAVIVGVLAGVTVVEFTAASQDPPIGDTLPADQQVTAQQHKPLSPPLIAPQPKPADPPLAAPQPDPGPPVAAPRPVPVDQPVAVRRVAPTHRDPVVRPVFQRQAPVPEPTAPPVHQPAVPAPDRDPQPAAPPPSSAMPARNAKSRTVNTEPCNCDGKMRNVQTHWDPPQS